MGRTLKPILLAVAIAAALFLAHQYNAREYMARALDWIGGQGTVGAVLYVALYAAACVLFLPGSILTLGAGAVYGVVKGSIIVSVASTLGAVCAFMVGRTVARGIVERKVMRNPSFKAVDDAVAREGWKIVLLTRLSPVFPFNLLNYAYGVTQVTLRDYTLASWIGMMPGTVMYVYIGSLAGDAARASSGAAEWALRIVGFVATVVVTVYITRIAKRALAQKVGQSGQPEKP